jgi:hypothetical protein
MPTPPSFSPLTLRALADVISGGPGNGLQQPIGIYRSGPKIESLVRDCNLDLQIGSNSRLPALIDFLRELAADPKGRAGIVRLIERVADPRDYLADPSRGDAAIDHLNAHLVVDGLELILDGHRPRLRERGAAGTVVGMFAAKAEKLNFDTVIREIGRALDSADHDPEDAVTAACSLVEAVCRSILIELRLPLPAKRDIDGVVRAVQEPLGLMPGRIDLPSEIAVDVRQVLGGLTTVAKGIGALRTHAGDAQGRERGFGRIDSRIARLAIHTSSTLALFLIETWELKFKREHARPRFSPRRLSTSPSCEGLQPAGLTARPAAGPCQDPCGARSHQRLARGKQPERRCRYSPILYPGT